MTARVCPQCRQRTGARVCPACRITTVDERALRGEDLVGKVFADKYEVEALLGRGGMGAVYRARHLSMDSHVALKVLRREAAEDLESIERFYREARAASRLKHPNTIRVFDFGQSDDGRLYLAMEYLEGVSLREELRRVGRMDEARILHVAEQVATSLGEAHSLEPPIIHRDVKPENVFLTRMYRQADFVKVLDFGIAKTAGAESLTRSGAAIGTPRYMSPEQAAGRAVDGRSDLYSLGVMLYEMACGAPPFASDTPMRLLLMHMHEQPERLRVRCPEVSAELEGLVMALLQKEPSARPSSAEDLLARLAAVRRLSRPEPPVTPRTGEGATPAVPPARPAPPPATAGQGTQRDTPAAAPQVRPPERPAPPPTGPAGTLRDAPAPDRPPAPAPSSVSWDGAAPGMPGLAGLETTTPLRSAAAGDLGPTVALPPLAPEPPPPAPRPHAPPREPAGPPARGGVEPAEEDVAADSRPSRPWLFPAALAAVLVAVGLFLALRPAPAPGPIPAAGPSAPASPQAPAEVPATPAPAAPAPVPAPPEAPAPAVASPATTPVPAAAAPPPAVPSMGTSKAPATRSPPARRGSGRGVRLDY